MSFALAILLLAAPAVAAPPAETFELTIADSAFATEEFRRTDGAEGISITGKVALDIPGAGAAVLKQETLLGRDGHLLSYSLDVDAPGQALVISALPSSTGYTLAATPKGASEPAQSRDVLAKPPAFLLDNNFASHFDALTRALTDLGPGGERAITVLVPQVFQAIPASVKRGPDGKGVLNGAAVATRTYRLSLANVGTDLIAREGDGALMRAEVSMQQAVLNRRGFGPAKGAPVAAPAGAAGDSGDARERAIEVKGPAGALPATLLVPKAAGPVPAVIFLAGSGPNDKDETIGPNKPFADIARGLGDRGIASLRIDKRTFAIQDKSKFQTMTLADEYDDDAKAAIAVLAATAGIDPTRLFVLGHSEGAMVAPRVASRSPEARGVVMMAPGVRPIDAMIIDQMESGARMTGRSADEIAEQTGRLKETFAAIRDPKRTDTPPFMGASAAYWRELMALDVPKLVRDSKMPILVLQGDEDIQVRKDADFEFLRTSVGDTKGRVTYRSFAGLNHLFMKVERRSTGAEYGFPGHVEPAVISAIADWVLLR